MSDGLPAVDPTPARVAAMLGDVADPDAVLGTVPPLFGELTARGVATACVRAGAPPGALPVVLAAARACLAPDLNLLGVATTTGTAAVALIVAGPVGVRLGLSHGTGLLGPGPHANGAVGRALALALADAGGVRPGETTMATTAQPARYTCCLAEDPDGPWGTLAARRGAPDSPADAVTVVPVGGTAEVLPREDLTDPDAVLAPLADALAGAVLAAGRLERGADLTQVLVLPPEVAARLATTVGDPVRVLHERGDAALRARTGRDDLAVAREIAPVVAGGPGVKMLHLPGWIGGSHAVTAPLREYLRPL
ncbi:hypothetical protein GCM10023200_08030 [Actinomycetospora chlora]|uniref:Uncharacterized protein n=1 Tax=Actinomycetospora chlora TaxID=663608 RepID=A0ABP9AB21_9PSEU